MRNWLIALTIFSPGAMAHDIPACVLNLYTNTALSTDDATSVCQDPGATESFQASVIEVYKKTSLPASGAVKFVRLTGNRPELRACLLDLYTNMNLSAPSVAEACIAMNADSAWQKCTLDLYGGTSMDGVRAVNQCAGKTILKEATATEPAPKAQTSNGVRERLLNARGGTELIYENGKVVKKIETCPYDLEAGKFIDVKDYKAYTDYLMKVAKGTAEVRPCPQK